MKIHSDTLSELEIRKAARITGVEFTRFALHGSRTRAAAFDVILTGSSPRRQNTRGATDDYAATWDEWGMFLGLLFALDPAMATPYYVNADNFHWQTNGRFRFPERENFTPGHCHKWEFTGENLTGSYWVHECKTCPAIRRHGDWDAVSNA